MCVYQYAYMYLCTHVYFGTYLFSEKALLKFFKLCRLLGNYELRACSELNFYPMFYQKLFHFTECTRKTYQKFEGYKEVADSNKYLIGVEYIF